MRFVRISKAPPGGRESVTPLISPMAWVQILQKLQQRVAGEGALLDPARVGPATAWMKDAGQLVIDYEDRPQEDEAVSRRLNSLVERAESLIDSSKGTV